MKTQHSKQPKEVLFLLFFVIWFVLYTDDHLKKPYPEPAAVAPPRAYYKRSCYNYHTNLTAQNICYKMTNFSGSLALLHSCIRHANSEMLNNVKGIIKKNSTADGNGDGNDGGGGWFIKGVHWVLVGDSHIRYLFSAFLTRFRSPGIKYRKLHTQSWNDTGDIEKILRLNVIQDKIYVLDRDINFRMTFMWDKYLTVLQEAMEVWERQPQDTPNLVILGTALHWMVRTQQVFFSKGAEAAAAMYREHLRRLRPQLTRLTKRTTVVFKLLDYLKRAYVNNSKEVLKTHSNYVLYNEIAVQELAGTGVVVWDSTVPLSDGYARECIRSPNKQTPPYFHWKCQDLGHVGFILVDQYADMVINDFCYKHLNL